MNLKKITILICFVIALWQSVPNVSTQTQSGDDCANRQLVNKTDTPRFALLVGINKYKHTENPPVPGAETDVKLIKDVLVENYNFPDDEKHIKTLKTAEATRERILGEFQNFLIANAEKNADKNPIIVFYFSGHGTQYNNQPNDTLDGDALDGLDEAIVPYDSRDPQIFDILDDEIDDLSAELARYSSNILYVFDSCHSGTVSRGNLARETTPNPLNAERKLYARRFPPSDADEARRKKIVTLAAALPHQSAYPKLDLTDGLMTFHLAAALRRAARNTTYQELMREVRAGVRSENSEQHPFADGDENRFVLAEASNRADSSVQILSDVENGKIKFAAGKIHGVQTGTQVAIYDRCATRFVGDENFLTYANVSEVGDREAIAVLPDDKTYPKVKLVNKNSRLVLTAPTFGGNPISLLLDDASLAARAVGTEDIRAEIRQILDAPNNELKVNQLVELTDFAALQKMPKEKEPGAILRLRRGKFGAVFPDTSRLRLPDKCLDKDKMFPPADTEVYYLQSGMSKDDKNPAPLFGRFFLAEDATAAAKEIIENIGIYTRQRNLINLENKNSSLNSRIELELKTVPVSVSPSCPTAGKKTIDLAADRCNCADGVSPAIENNQISQNAAFQIEIKNVSRPGQDSKLYVAALLVSGDGKIKMVSPKDTSKMELTTTKPFKVGFFATQPAGAEMLKIIITTKPEDLEGIGWLETADAAQRSKGASSPLERLLSQSGLKSRGNTTLAPNSPNSWGVKTIEWMVGETKFTCACRPK